MFIVFNIYSLPNWLVMSFVADIFINILLNYEPF